MPATMTALFGGTGPDWESCEVPVPKAGPGQVLVRARAVALNNADAAMLADADPTAGDTGKKYQAGFEFAGEIVAVGDGVAVLAATGGQGVELVLDHVGGQTFADCLPAARIDGAVINIGRLDTAESTINLDTPSYRHMRLRGVSFGFTRATELGAIIAAAGEQLLPAVADGRVRPLIDGALTFDTAARAAVRLRSHQAHGKLVLIVP
ncbi:zinc-binding dehydrogenase [Streptomyces sp. NPDC005181]|uniref:zinc-binding dehydrogenase n=1 Tax=Streptomyces sp. NPDC005181 TaxID=3156869 RepID=UPI0033B40F99